MIVDDCLPAEPLVAVALSTDDRSDEDAGEVPLACPLTAPLACPFACPFAAWEAWMDSSVYALASAFANTLKASRIGR